MTLEGRVARVEVTERFRNSGGTIAEGSYLYPLPGEAVFSNFSLWSGDQELKGETMRAEEARRIYEEIVRRRKDPALLSLAGHGLVRAQVFPIQPGETRTVALRYTQVPGRSGDAVRLHYALGLRGPEAGTELEIAVSDAGAYGTPFSPTHRLDARRDGGRLTIRVAPESAGDVEIFLPIERGLAGAGVVTHAIPGEDGYLCRCFPRLGRSGSRGSADLTLVVDVLVDVRHCWSRPRPLPSRRSVPWGRRTGFGSSRFPPRSGRSAQASHRRLRRSRRAAREFIDGLGAEGGTNISGAMDARSPSPRTPSDSPWWCW
jgi:Ca-activated chloride channel family protein